MKKYIYVIILLISASDGIANAQNISSDKVVWKQSNYINGESLLIPIVKLEFKEILPTQTIKYGYSTDLVGLDRGCWGGTSKGNCQYNTCIQDATIYIDGIRLRGEARLTHDSNIPLPRIDQNDKNIENISSGPGTGLEGHNFLESPAIIYPNPVKDIMNIKSTDPITVIEILNAHGEVDKSMDSRNELLDVTDLAAGVYYVRIHFENKKTVQVEKILVVK